MGDFGSNLIGIITWSMNVVVTMIIVVTVIVANVYAAIDTLIIENYIKRGENQKGKLGI